MNAKILVRKKNHLKAKLLIKFALYLKNVMILVKVIEQISKVMGFDIKEDIIVSDVRFEPYANVIFDHDIYPNRRLVKKYLQANDIIPIGRFGEWAYLWSDQSLMSGVGAAKKIISSQCGRVKK